MADDDHDDNEKLHNSSHTPDAVDDQLAETDSHTYVVDLGDEQIYYYRDEKRKGAQL